MPGVAWVATFARRPHGPFIHTFDARSDTLPRAGVFYVPSRYPGNGAEPVRLSAWLGM